MRPRSLDEFLTKARIPYTTFRHPPAFTAMHAAAVSHTGATALPVVGRFSRPRHIQSES
jgi:hypothetical protein